MIIVGTDDAAALNSLMLVERIPGAGLIQIRDTGYGLVYEYPDKFNRVLMTFLENNRWQNLVRLPVLTTYSDFP